MIPTSNYIQKIYLTLTLFSTLASSFIWGVNTLFLLDAGLSNAEAFAANAFFTAGQVLFEVPTGVLADTKGRRISYALGTIVLLLTTLAYVGLWYTSGPFWLWAVISALLGLGFTFFSGATEAWLVDSLNFTKFKGSLESVFAKGQAVGGAAMLVGAVSGGFIAQFTNLGVPYLLRAIILGATFLISIKFMKDWGFEPSEDKGVRKHVKNVLSTSMKNGWNVKSIRWMMVASTFSVGISFYLFYAMQPHLLNLFGDKEAYGIAGLVAAIVAGSQIVGGLSVNFVRKFFKKRTSLLIFSMSLSIVVIIAIGLSQSFWLTLILISLWGIVFAVSLPVRQTYLNSLIDSKQRATVLSFDSLVGNTGGIVTQPVLGRIADVNGYASSFLASSLILAGSIPFLMLAKKQNVVSDTIVKE